MGVAAAEWVLDAGAHEEPLMIGMEGYKIVRKPLMQCVELVPSPQPRISAYNYLIDASSWKIYRGKKFRTGSTCARGKLQFRLENL